MDSTQPDAFKRFLDYAATVAFILVCAVFIWKSAFGGTGATTPPPVPIPSEPLTLDGAALRGASAASVAVIELSDFKCPFCGEFARDILPEFDRRYVDSGKVIFAFRQYPLAVHPEAFAAAEAVQCAGLQGLFWPMHDRLFQSQDRLDASSLMDLARSLHLNTEQFDTCLVKHGMRANVHGDVALAKSLRISSTPTFLVGTVQKEHQVKVTRVLSGLQTLAALSRAVDSLITEADHERAAR